MTTLLVAKQYLRAFYSKYEVYLAPVLKFLLAFISLLVINMRIGYMGKIDNIAVVLVAALMCSFMPVNFILVIAALFILLHLYALSLECMAVILGVFLLMFLLYFRFSPRDTLVVLLTPLCFVFKVPYVMPIAMGLLGNPASIVSVSCGVVVYYMISYVAGSATALSTLDMEEAAARFRYIIDGLLNNKGMFATVAAFAVTVVLVYLIRRMSVDHAWTIAIIAGALADVTVLLVGDLMFDTNVAIGGIIVGTVFSVLICKVIQFFAFNVDYSRTENVQFEDDEYYYYVKAVPKVTVATPERTVKKINPQRRKSPSGGGARPSSSQGR